MSAKLGIGLGIIVTFTAVSSIATSVGKIVSNRGIEASSVSLSSEGIEGEQAPVIPALDGQQ